MTTRNFITKQFGNADGNTRTCSSVLKDGQGNMYSYGYHYPLLFTVDGLTFRNTAGYSSTTIRHIAWSRGINAIDIELAYSDRLHLLDLNTLVSRLHEQRDGLLLRLQAKKRKDTAIYRILFGQLVAVESNIARVESARGVK